MACKCGLPYSECAAFTSNGCDNHAGDAGYSLGDILRDALRIKDIKEDNRHFRYYETLTNQYEAAGMCNA